MKKLSRALGILVILALISAFFFLNNKPESYDSSKEQNLNLGNSILECKAAGGAYCPELPNKIILDKLETIKDLKGIEECSSDSYECVSLIRNCNNISDIAFTSSRLSGGTGSTYTTISFYDCGNKGYYVSETSSPPPKMTISLVQLTAEQISKLK